MATANTTGTGQLTRQPSRWKRNLMLLVLLVGFVALAFAWTRLRERAVLASARAAQAGCVCAFVTQRGAAQCEGAGSGALRIAVDAPGRRVSASVPLLASQSAAWSAATGCQLETWQR